MYGFVGEEHLCGHGVFMYGVVSVFPLEKYKQALGRFRLVVGKTILCIQKNKKNMRSMLHVPYICKK